MRRRMPCPVSSVAEGLVLVGTLVVWNYLLDWASYRFVWVRRFAEPPPLLLIRDGKVLAQPATGVPDAR